MRHRDRSSAAAEGSSAIFGQRVMLRPILLSDFAAWREVRHRCGEWLTRWEPQRLPHQPDITEDRDAFAIRCSARQRAAPIHLMVRLNDVALSAASSSSAMKPTRMNGRLGMSRTISPHASDARTASFR